jgi:hypothetical protein
MRMKDIFENEHARVFSREEEEQKRLLYGRLAPRRRRFIDRLGYAAWDPFQPPKDPLDIRRDSTRRTVRELTRDFLRARGGDAPGGEYAGGVLQCALGLVNREDKFQGIYDFCLWYNKQLETEAKEQTGEQ